MSIGLLRVLYQQKIIGTEQVDQYREALDKKQNILPLLFESNVIKADGLAQLLSQTFRFPLLDLSQYNSSLLVADVLSDTQIQAHRCIPIFQRGRRLFLARQAGLEPATCGFGDRCSANCATDVC